MDCPSTMPPALKSIHLGLRWYRLVLVDIFIVGTKLPNGVPLPVVNNTIWQPEAANAVAATRSLPGELNKFKPGVLRRSPYKRTSRTVDLPHFCVQPSDFSSSVEMPPALLPGEGFS